jgi:DNA-binding MarR family transcriptional regulator
MNLMINETHIQLSKDWIKAVYLLKKSLDKWAVDNLQDVWDGDFQPGYMQFLLSADALGMTNKELALNSGISKQAMSKIISRLSELGMIYTTPSPDDKRVMIIKLTEKGEQVTSESLKRFTEVIAGYQPGADGHTVDESRRTLQIIQHFISNFK